MLHDTNHHVIPKSMQLQTVLVRSHQCSTAYIHMYIVPLVPRVYILKITQSSCGFLSMYCTFTCTCTCTRTQEAAYKHVIVTKAQMGEYVSTQTLVIHQWAGPSVVAQLAPDSTPDRAE